VHLSLVGEKNTNKEEMSFTQIYLFAQYLKGLQRLLRHFNVAIVTIVPF
jgi:hypothetical protein